MPRASKVAAKKASPKTAPEDSPKRDKRGTLDSSNVNLAPVTVFKGTRQVPSTHDPYAEPLKKISDVFDAFDKIAAADEKATLQAATKLEGTEDLRGLIELAQEMQSEKETKEQLEAEAKVHNDRYNELRNILIPDKMKQLGLVDASGKGSFTFRGGKVHLETTVSASCTKENEPRFFAWAKANGAADIIKTTVNHQTLSGLIRERRADGLEDPPGVVVFEQVKAKLTVKK